MPATRIGSSAILQSPTSARPPGQSPGAGHLWLGRRKGLIFLVVLPVMFALGLMLEGRIFPFELSQPLVALAALANLGIGVPSSSPTPRATARVM